MSPFNHQALCRREECCSLRKQEVRQVTAFAIPSCKATLASNWTMSTSSSMTPSPEQERLRAGAAAVFIDLEYVAALPLLSRICSQKGIELRSYAKEDHPTASRATHKIQSKEREAVNMQMVWDMAMYCSDKHQVAHVLLVTGEDDCFGKTLASLDLVASRVSWAPLGLDMPQPWRRALGSTSAKDFFTKQPAERRHARSRSRSRRGRSLSRGGSLSCDDDISDGDGSSGDGSGDEGNGKIGGGGEGAGGGGEGGDGEGGGGEGGGGEGSGGEGSGGLRDGQEAALVEVARADHPDASSPAGAPGQGQPGQGWGNGRRRWIFSENGSVHPVPGVADTPSPTTTARIFDRCCDAVTTYFAASDRLTRPAIAYKK